MTEQTQKKIDIKVETLESINATDLADLCNVTEQAINNGGGFGWLKPPPRETLNKFWKGAIIVSNRKLIVGRLNNAIAGTLQIIFHPSNNEAQQNNLTIVSHFVAPWARGFGLANLTIDRAEMIGIDNGSSYAHLDVRETQEAAIKLFESKGYSRWGTNPHYAFVDGENVKGYYYYKKIK